MEFKNDFMGEMDFDYENRIMSTEQTRSDTEPDTSLRPETLSDYVGQDKAKENLKV